MASGEKGGRTRCVTCGKDNKATFTCRGCLEDFCYNHITDHRQDLSKQLDDIEVTRDLFRQTLTQHTQQPHKHISIQQINDWEYKSIKKIQQTAEEARQTLFEYTVGHIKQIEIDLNNLTDELRESRKENDFFETDLRQWNEQLNRLTKELNQPSNVYFRQESTSLINKFSIYVSTCKSTIEVIIFIKKIVLF